MRIHLQDTPHQYPAFLYRIVYSSRPVSVVVVLLLSSFVIQPIARVEAGEEVAVPSSVDVSLPTGELTTTTEIPLPPNSIEVTADTIPVEGEPTITTTAVSDTSTPVDADNTLIRSAGDSQLATDTPAKLELVSDQFVNDEASTTDSEAVGSDTTISSTAIGSTTPAVDAVATTSLVATNDQEEQPENVEVGIPEISSNQYDATVVSATSTTPSTTDEVPPLVHETYSDAEVRFLKRDCVAVGGGAFYCHMQSTKGSAKDALIAAPDSGGDLEIFLVKDGEYIQLTFNDVDDAAPYYDGRSQTMVWHRLVGDTQVIFEYDFETGEERAITRGLENDMEPSRFGDRTVWQRWVDDRWQILLNDNGEEIQLTTADAHHVAPVIREEIVMWQTIDVEGLKQIETLDLLTGTYQSINDSESAALANPRMMMVYEAVYDNGDVVTRGVDLKTGQVVSLDALPTELPDEIPPTDSTGETRALIQAKPTQKEGELEPDSEPTPLLPPVSSTTDSLTLDLSTGDSSLPASTTIFGSLELKSTDLIIGPLATDMATVTASSTE